MARWLGDGDHTPFREVILLVCEVLRGEEVRVQQLIHGLQS